VNDDRTLHCISSHPAREIRFAMKGDTGSSNSGTVTSKVIVYVFVFPQSGRERRRKRKKCIVKSFFICTHNSILLV
jgi:hypothetical protein